MVALISGLILMGLLLVALSAQKTYSYVPLKELKRQARAGDELAKVLYGAAGYGLSLQFLLWLVIGLTAAGSFVLLQLALPSWLTFIVLVFVLWLGFMWLPTSRLSAWAARIISFITPAITWALHYAHPLLDGAAHFLQRYQPVTFHTGLYEREDIIELLRSQATQPDNRIAMADLVMAEHVLQFGDKQVLQRMTPLRMIKGVQQTDVVGPVLMDELHESGHSRFPVYSVDQSVVGILYLRDLVAAKQGGAVKNVMRSEVYYVHEDHDLRQVLHAFLHTKHHLFIVVNEFEEYVGLITIEDVLEEIVGQPIVDEFDQYEDLRAVAASRGAKEHQAHKNHEAVVE